MMIYFSPAPFFPHWTRSPISSALLFFILFYFFCVFHLILFLFFIFFLGLPPSNYCHSRWFTEFFFTEFSCFDPLENLLTSFYWVFTEFFFV